MNKWINFEQEKPKSQDVVLVCVKGKKYKYVDQIKDYIEVPHYYLTMATYISPRTVLAEDWFDYYDDGTVEYDEKNDCYWLYEGFYEYNSEDSIQYEITNKVTHWMKLPNLPEIIENNKDKGEK